MYVIEVVNSVKKCWIAGIDGVIDHKTKLK